MLYIPHYTSSKKMPTHGFDYLLKKFNLPKILWEIIIITLCHKVYTEKHYQYWKLMCNHEISRKIFWLHRKRRSNWRNISFYREQELRWYLDDLKIKNWTQKSLKTYFTLRQLEYCFMYHKSHEQSCFNISIQIKYSFIAEFFKCNERKFFQTVKDWVNSRIWITAKIIVKSKNWYNIRGNY